MRDSVIGRRKIEMDGADMREAVRLWLKSKGIVPPLQTEITVTVNVVVKAPITDTEAFIEWNAEVSR